MGAAAVAMVALALLAAEDGPAPTTHPGVQVAVGLRGEGRTNSFVAPGGQVTTRGSANAVPRVSLVVGTPSLRLASAYQALLSWPDLATSRFDVLHRADLAGDVRFARTWRLTTGLFGTYGETDPVAPPDGVAVPDVVATADALRSYSATASVRLAGGASRRSTATVAVGASTSGGLDAPSRALFPVQHTLRLDAGATWGLTRRDVLGADVAATASRVTGARSAGVALASAKWRRTFTRALDGWGALGVGLDYDEAPNQRTGTWIPMAELGVAHGFPRLGLTETLTARFAPFIDRLSGAVSERFSASASLDWRASRRLAFGTRASGARVLGEADAAVASSSVVGLDGRVSFQAARGVAFQAGVWGQRQHVSGAALPSFFEGGTYLAFVLERTRF